MAQRIDAVLIGAGLRGRFTYGGYARAHPDRLRIVAVAEPDEGRRRALAEEHRLAAEDCFEDWRALLDAPRRAPAAIVATGDTLHVDPALAALAAGYHLLLEKPIAMAPDDCVRVVEAAALHGRILQIGHVLRYSAFYSRVAAILASGRLGRLVTLDLREHVAYWHMTHSFVRGKFRNTGVAAPFLVAKCCHDLDLMVWLAGAPVRRVTSFGSLSHYRPERAPEGAPERCTDGCPVQTDCIHDAVRFYAGPPEALARIWPWSDVSSDPSSEARRAALETGRYGRCVYRCDNDVVDHQVVSVEFEGGVLGSFGVHGHGSHENRTLRVTGTEGELRGLLHEGVIEVHRHGGIRPERIEVPGNALGHYGGDEGLVDHFVEIAGSDAAPESRTSGRSALASHLVGFAAERSRERGEVVDFAGYLDALGARV
ncbi:MAG: Gfo/Idh/MocA family protein [Myxococcota bacterium]